MFISRLPKDVPGNPGVKACPSGACGSTPESILTLVSDLLQHILGKTDRIPTWMMPGRVPSKRKNNIIFPERANARIPVRC